MEQLRVWYRGLRMRVMLNAACNKLLVVTLLNRASSKINRVPSEYSRPMCSLLHIRRKQCQYCMHLLSIKH